LNLSAFILFRTRAVISGGSIPWSGDAYFVIKHLGNLSLRGSHEATLSHNTPKIASLPNGVPQEGMKANKKKKNVSMF
jgi:hypothetical protein